MHGITGIYSRDVRPIQPACSHTFLHAGFWLLLLAMPSATPLPFETFNPVNPWNAKQQETDLMIYRKVLLPLLITIGMAFAINPWSANAADEATYDEDGKYFTANDEPIYKITEDGTVDWYTYSGFRRYHSECHVCHGPEASGSTFAPALKDSLKTMSYETFLETVASGRERTTPDGSISKMPALGDNVNVWCYIDDIYVYLKARASGTLPPGRPTKRADKPQSAKDFENDCVS